MVSIKPQYTTGYMGVYVTSAGRATACAAKRSYSESPIENSSIPSCGGSGSGSGCSVGGGGGGGGCCCGGGGGGIGCSSAPLPNAAAASALLRLAAAAMALLLATATASSRRNALAFHLQTPSPFSDTLRHLV